jgi:hypothetical protein
MDGRVEPGHDGRVAPGTPLSFFGRFEWELSRASAGGGISRIRKTTVSGLSMLNKVLRPVGACAPSTALCAVPLPRFAREDQRERGRATWYE